MRSGRMISSADTSAIGAGLASLGAGISAYAKEQVQQQNVVDVARAEAFKTEALLGVQNAFDSDPDYATYEKRAPQKTQEVVDKAANLIRDPEMRERWRLGAMAHAARVNDVIRDKGFTLSEQAETVALDESLETYRRVYVDPETPDDVKEKARSELMASIDMAEKAGKFTPAMAQARRDKFVKGGDFTRAELAVARDPSSVSRPLPAKVSDRASAAMGYFTSRGWTKEQAAGIVGNLLAESSLNTGARNPGDGNDGSDSVGVAQWNGDRARALKAFASANHSDWRDFNVQLAFVDHELRTSESAAGNALRNAKDVDEATAAFVGYERPAGWSSANPRGGHNYKGRLKFASAAAGGSINPEWMDRLPPEQREKIYQDAETRNKQIAVDNRGVIETVVQNAPAAIMNTGQYDGPMPSYEQFSSAYGPQEGADRYAAFQSAVDVADTAYDMQTMSTDDIEQIVQDALPTSSGNDAALETQRYETLAKAAENTLKARKADPAAYVQRVYPSVADAWAGVQNGAGYRQAMAMSAAAQEQLGIQNPRLLPSQIANNAVTVHKDETKAEEERIGTITSLIFSTDDPAQRRAVFDQLVEAGLPDMTEGAVEALARGDEGAGRRLFQAAMVDPSKLPGKIDAKPTDIDAAIQDALMAEGEVGDIYYGLSDGTADNYVRAQRDNKLLVNAVSMRMRSGETLDAAVTGAGKDLYGDLQVVNESNAKLLLPADADPDVTLDRLNAVMPEVRSQLEAFMAIPSQVTGTQLAVTEAATQNRIEDILSSGYFKNSGDGFVFIDPYTGGAVSDATGDPVIFHFPSTPPVAPQMPVAPPAMDERDRSLDEFLKGP